MKLSMQLAGSAALVLVVAGLWFLIGPQSGGPDGQMPPGMTAGGPSGGSPGGARVPKVVASAPVQQTFTDKIVAIGTARGVQSVTLGAGVSGRVVAIDAAQGQQITAGAPILRLDAEAAELDRARAQLVLEDARAAMVRQERLSGSGAASDLARAEAELELREAELDLREAERKLADHQITAPISGYLGLIAVQPGDLVTPATELARIEDRSRLVVDFSVPERVVARLRVGDPVEAAALSDPSLKAKGQITALDSRLDEASRALRVQAEIPNDTDALRAGMALRVGFVFTGADYPSVDPLAIQWGGEGAYVWLLRDGKAQRLPVRIVQRNADAVLLEAAFQPGDLVATEGVQGLRAGQPAEVIGQEAAPSPAPPPAPKPEG